MVFNTPPRYGRCECNPCEHRCEAAALREENDWLKNKLARAAKKLRKCTDWGMVEAVADSLEGE